MDPFVIVDYAAAWLVVVLAIFVTFLCAAGIVMFYRQVFGK